MAALRRSAVEICFEVLLVAAIVYGVHTMMGDHPSLLLAMVFVVVFAIIHRGFNSFRK
jgi:hypothetical protein